MHPNFYLAVGIVIIPLWVLSIKRGLLLGRRFKAMAAELESNQINWEVAKLRSALLQWTRSPAKVVEMCEDPRAREIVGRHADLAIAESKRLKIIITVWSVVGIAGAVLWLLVTETKGTNQASHPSPSPWRG